MIDRTLEHGELFWPDTTRLLPAEYLFNPTLIRWAGDLWMIYRRVTPQPGLAVTEWSRTLAMCRLDASLEPDYESNVDVSSRICDPRGARRWHADARFFLRDDGPWIWYHDNNDVYLCPLRPDEPPGVLNPKRVVLTGRPRRRQERNWGMFDDGTFKAIYTVDPLITLAIEDAGEHYTARPLSETDSNHLWDSARWGEPHGGSSPIQVDSCWFAFFSSNRTVDVFSGQKTYCVGFWGFDANPPHRLRYLSKAPLLEADSVPGERSFYCNHAVVYPSGAVYDSGRWIVSLGIHDRTPAFVAFDHERLLDGCSESMTACGLESRKTLGWIPS